MKNSQATLHRKVRSGAALFAVLAVSMLVPHCVAQSADELVGKVLAARGGVDKLKAIKTQRVSGQISFGPGAEGPFVVEFMRPEKMHMEITVAGQTIVRVYDGKNGWVINPFAPNKDVQPMEAGEVRNISDEADFDGPLMDYQSKGNRLELLGKDEVNGKAVNRLKLTNKNGDARTYFFDASTNLLVKWEGTRKLVGQEIPVETFFSDYREVNGIKFAFEIDSDSPGSDQQQKIAIDKIETNPQIDGGRFVKPTSPAASPFAVREPQASPFAASAALLRR